VGRVAGSTVERRHTALAVDDIVDLTIVVDGIGEMVHHKVDLNAISLTLDVA
jgi:hypothetical protein